MAITISSTHNATADTEAQKAFYQWRNQQTPEALEIITQNQTLMLSLAEYVFKRGGLRVMKASSALADPELRFLCRFIEAAVKDVDGDSK